MILLDAGTFDVITPMLDRGRLPAFRKIMRGGVSGTLISTIPPLTPPAWASFATGVNPGKHGVYNFCERKEDKAVPVTSYSIRRETLWSMLNATGKKVILLNTPVTYPPRKVNGIVVTGLLTPGNVPYTYPENFRKELLREFPQYFIHARTKPWEDEHLYLEEAHNLLRERRDATLYLMENYDWDFFVSYFYYTDNIQHNFWEYMDATHPAHDPDAPPMFRDAIAKAYEIVDESIEEILKRIDDDTVLMVMSDHGAGPVYKYVFINNYLKTIGVLNVRTKGAIKLTVDKFMTALDVHLPRLSKFVPGTRTSILDKIRENVNKKHITEPVFEYVNWTQTKAISLGALGQIFVNHDALKSTEEYEQLIRYLIQKLFELRDAEDGERIVDEIFRKSQIFHGEYVDRAPDLYFIMRKMTYVTTGGLHVTNQILGLPLMGGHHRKEGILIMYGKNLREGHTLKDCNIMDLTPTILYLMGLPVPSDLDGRVLTNAFDPSYARKHPVRLKEKPEVPVERERYELSKEEKEKVKERLRALGYM